MEKWIVDPESAEEAKAGLSDESALKKWPSFEADVAENPFYNATPKRIAKLKRGSGYPDKTYRYRKDPLRVIYIPNRDNNVVYPIEAASASSASYKRRSKK